jgi:hypothetical protein
MPWIQQDLEPWKESGIAKVWTGQAGFAGKRGISVGVSWCKPNRLSTCLHSRVGKRALSDCTSDIMHVCRGLQQAWDFEPAKPAHPSQFFWGVVDCV